jgi:hypothetical protein
VPPSFILEIMEFRDLEELYHRYRLLSNYKWCQVASY